MYVCLHGECKQTNKAWMTEYSEAKNTVLRVQFEL